jgi:hypothetical protein
MDAAERAEIQARVDEAQREGEYTYDPAQAIRDVRTLLYALDVCEAERDRLLSTIDTFEKNAEAYRAERDRYRDALTLPLAACAFLLPDAFKLVEPQFNNAKVALGLASLATEGSNE